MKHLYKSLKYLAYICLIILNFETFGQVQRNPVLEYCTGTWCQYCPCGHEIIRGQIVPAFPNAIILGYHGPSGSGDPYAGFNGNSIIGMLGFSGYPTGIVDRTSAPLSRSSWYGVVSSRNTITSPVEISIIKNYNPETRILSGFVEVLSYQELTGDYYVNMILTEDDLVYPQTGNSGCIGGTNYVHEHVVRDMLNGPSGISLNQGEVWANNTSKYYTFNFVIGSGFIADNCHLVVLVYKKNTGPFNQGQIQQAEQYDLTGTSMANMFVSEGWNILSVPYLTTDMSTTTLFPDAASPAYYFTNGYQTASTLQNGKGYWVKFNSINGYLIEGSTVNDPVALQEGWNIIGPYDKAVTVSNITTNPPSLLESTFFGFSTSYFVSSQLLPGKGYWVKSSAAGELNFNTTSAKNQANQPAALIEDSWNKITVTDISGNTADLYLSPDNVISGYYDMPPVPPAGAFDVRYSSGKFLEGGKESPKTIELSSARYPVTIRNQGQDISISGSNFTSRILKDGDSFTLGKNTNEFTVEFTGIPADLSLGQNYPNPFNPSTSITVSLPFDSEISLDVFDLLGRKAGEIFKGKAGAGVHTYNFDGSNLSSGIYVYVLKAGDKILSGKMTLLK